MQTTSVTASYGFPNRVIQFKYDHLGRRVQKRVINASTSAEISSRRFVYDGWNLVAEYNAPPAAPASAPSCVPTLGGSTS